MVVVQSRVVTCGHRLPDEIDCRRAVLLADQGAVGRRVVDVDERHCTRPPLQGLDLIRKFLAANPSVLSLRSRVTPVRSPWPSTARPAPTAAAHGGSISREIGMTFWLEKAEM